MQRWRWVLATAIVVGLGAFVAVLLREDPSEATTTTVVATTTTTAAPTTSTTAVTTLTTTVEQRQAEVEMILKELWFGWFDAIYRKDADALWEVVATQRFHEAGLAAMESMTFLSPPSNDSVQVTNVEVLLDRPDCLVAFYSLSPDFLSEDESTLLSVLWPDARLGWRFATSWLSPTDLWLDDCDELVREETP